MQVPFRSRRLLFWPIPAAQKLLSALELRMDLGLTQRKRLRLIFAFCPFQIVVSNNAGVRMVESSTTLESYMIVDRI